MSKVLIVEDAYDGTEAISRSLTAAGHTVRVVGNGKEALGEIINDTPDVILLDLLLPDLDGPSLLEILRAYLRLNSLPVVVLTGLLKVSEVLVKGKASL